MLRVRWLGRVPFAEARALQAALHSQSAHDYLLMVEHPHVFTMGVRGDPSHILVNPVTEGADVERADRGGEVTYHGPGQLVVYPVVSVRSGPRSIPGHVWNVEQMVIDALGDFELHCGRLTGTPGVWVEPEGDSPRKIAAVGVRVTRGRAMHGVAVNVDPDLTWFGRIVPCGISDKAVTSMAVEGLSVSMHELADAIVRAAAHLWAGEGGVERQDVAWSADILRLAGPHEPDAHDLERRRVPGSALRRRLRQAGVDPTSAVAFRSAKPPWLRVPLRTGSQFHALRRTVRSLELVTVCEEAGCPNIFECWADGTATFMINGERCTRACGFCLVDTRHPDPLDAGEPDRVALAVQRLGLAHAVVTAVARDDLPDGGAAAFAETVAAIRRRCPATAVELLVPDCKGDKSALDLLFASRPDVLNHNIETVARLQRAVRPSAGYARSLAVLARAKAAGLTTKSGLILGMGEEEVEVLATLDDLAAVGVDIVTIGQYLRPSEAHLPVARWWTPDDFDRIAKAARLMGFVHVQASPLTRSSYHARAAAGAAAGDSCNRVPGDRDGGTPAGDDEGAGRHALASAPGCR